MTNKASNKAASTKTASTKTASANVSDIVGSIDPEKSVSGVFTVTTMELSDNLFVDIEKNADDKLTNAQKAHQLFTWVNKAMVDNAVASMLVTIESAINSLPAGDTIINVFSKKLGKTIEGKKNHRDIAKDSLKTAWRNAIKVNENWKNTELNFRLSKPKVEPIAGKPEKTLQDKIIALLGDSIDTHGIVMIMDTIRRAQDDVKQQIAEGAALRAEARLSETIGENYRNLLTLGVDAEKAITRTALFLDVSEDRVKQVVAK